MLSNKYIEVKWAWLKWTQNKSILTYFLFYYLLTIIWVRYISINGSKISLTPIFIKGLFVCAFIGTILNINALTLEEGHYKLFPWKVTKFYIIPFCVSTYLPVLQISGQGLVVYDIKYWLYILPSVFILSLVTNYLWDKLKV